MIARSMLRITAAASVVVFTVAGASVAAAVEPPPAIDTITTAPPDGRAEPKPAVEMRQKSRCAESGVLDGTSFSDVPPASRAFDIDQLHRFADGEGITVAVIDSGVSASPRLPRLVDGGDYVAGDTGLSDCDHHGTLIAGIIAGSASPSDSFVGVAPRATVLSIRQTSDAFGPANPDDRDTAAAPSSLATAASAIVRAVEMGATVINASVTACLPAGKPHATSDLAAALRLAHDRGVVVVVSAGNADASGCEANPRRDTRAHSAARNWADVTDVSMPSYYSNMVISVGGSTLDGGPYLNTLAGPWVHVAAPAVNIVSLDPDNPTGLTNASVGSNGQKSAINGTSFSAAFVSGLAALIQQRYPGISPEEVKTRIMATAAGGSDSVANVVGAGVVRPVAALATPHVDPRDAQAAVTLAQNAPAPQQPRLERYLPAIVAVSLVTVLVAVSVLAVVVSSLRSAGTAGQSSATMTLREVRQAKRRSRAAGRQAARQAKRRRSALRSARRRSHR